jgi:AcrR family transcriptional regulator
MTETTRRDRPRADTEREIRQQARRLLVEQGREAVTLRAIARELGITAPALYRYYDSREDLLRRVIDDICLDLGAELTADLTRIDEHDAVGGVLAVCRGFRRWALAHPQEFTLVFASPDDSAHCEVDESTGKMMRPAKDQFGRIFLNMAGKLLATHKVLVPDEEKVPADLRADLIAFRGHLLAQIEHEGIELPEQALNLSVVYLMLQFWVRLYGQVALEVFGRFPFAVANPEPLFESMLTELFDDIGLADAS